MLRDTLRARLSPLGGQSRSHPAEAERERELTTTGNGAREPER